MLRLLYESKSWNISRIDNLRVELVSDYDAWAAAIGLDGGPDDDDDGDGHSNAEEYAFGLDPKSGASMQPYLALPVPATGMFTYTRRKRSLSGMDFTIWTSTDISGWTEETGATQTATGIPGAEMESVTVTLSPAFQNLDRLFVRIKSE